MNEREPRTLFHWRLSRSIAQGLLFLSPAQSWVEFIADGIA